MVAPTCTTQPIGSCSKDAIAHASSSQDPFHYCASSPILLIDPSGADWWWVVDYSLAPVEMGGTFIAGGADSLTMGVTKILREGMWGAENAKINYHAAYVAGEYTEVVVEVGVTGGSALLKKAAAKAVAKEAADYAVTRAGKSISKAAAEDAAKAAQDRIAAGLRREARELAEATKDEVTHHVHTLIGHPPYPGGILGPSRGPVRSSFPTLG